MNKNKFNKKKVVEQLKIWLPRTVVIIIELLSILLTGILNANLTYDQLKNLVELQWVMFGISIAIYLFWHVHVLNLFSGLIPKFNNKKLTQFKNYVESKRAIIRSVNMSLLPAIFLVVNSITILASTIKICVKIDAVSNFIIWLVVGSFYVSSITLLCLLFDTVGTFIRENRNLSDACKVTDDEEKLYDKIVLLEKAMDSIKKEINTHPEVSEEAKEECNKIIEKYRNILSDVEGVSLSDKPSEEK